MRLGCGIQIFDICSYTVMPKEWVDLLLWSGGWIRVFDLRATYTVVPELVNALAHLHEET